MDLLALARDLAACHASGARWVELPTDRSVVFVGDIHGDLDAATRALALAGAETVVFLGDLVDRGPASREVLAAVVAAKLERPQRVHVLMGNHEAWAVTPFCPADFWHSLSADEAASLGAALLRLPFAAWHPAGVLALHGALPDLGAVNEIADVEPGSEAWRDITWGDWTTEPNPTQRVASRPRLDARAFARRSARLGVRALVRSHQPDAPPYLFADRCLTLFTSNAYGGARRVAILRPGQRVDSARDLELVDV